jgi:hypothetical protein
MKVASLCDKGLLIEVDLQELRILNAALNSVCNGGQVLDGLEERLSGSRDKAETLLAYIRSLNSIFDRFEVEASPDDTVRSVSETGTATST